MNYLKDFFTEEQFNRLLSYCNDEDLHEGGDPAFSAKWDDRNLSDIRDKLDTMFIEYGYNTSHSNCRLQRTEPNAEYKTHKDFLGKRVSLIIYLIGEDGTTFYEDAVKQQDKTFKGINPTETHLRRTLDIGSTITKTVDTTVIRIHWTRPAGYSCTISCKWTETNQ